MEYLSNRIASFDDNGPWPLASPTPKQLAHCGFYYEGIDDNVTCNFCGKSLGGWDKDDDPAVEHLKHSPSCTWAQLLYSASHKIHEPNSKYMEDLLLLTFGKKWPHDKTKGFFAKSKKMAKAGFFFNPNPDSDDMVSCIFCNLGLDGWEADDDPIQEHRKRSPDCYFFMYGLRSQRRKHISSQQSSSRGSDISLDTDRHSLQKPSPELILDSSLYSQTRKRRRTKTETQSVSLLNTPFNKRVRRSARLSKTIDNGLAAKSFNLEQIKEDIPTKSTKSKKILKGLRRKSVSLESDQSPEKLTEQDINFHVQNKSENILLRNHISLKKLTASNFSEFLEIQPENATISDWVRHNAALLAKKADEEMVRDIEMVKKSCLRAIFRLLKQ